LRQVSVPASNPSADTRFKPRAALPNERVAAFQLNMNSSQVLQPESAARLDISTSFLDGGGELGGLMRSFDWTQTPLGPPSHWPRSLKTAVRIMLTSRQPIWLGWGPDLTYLYNDPYKSIIGGKHPRALGRPFSEVWREIWDVVGPMADTVMRRDEGTYVEAQLLIMERYGYPEETYYTFSYSPVPGDDGRPAGLICANTDDTRRVVGERQLATLSELSARTAGARDWHDACVRAADALASNRRDITFALIYMARGPHEPVAPVCASGGAERLLPVWLADAAIAVRDGEISILDIDGSLPGVPAAAWPRIPSHAAVLPIPDPAGGGKSGALVVGLNPFRQFDPSYRSFLEIVARQIGGSIANARAYEDERKRAEALAELDRAKTTFFSNISHELRTPLTLMLGPIEDMLNGAVDGAGGDTAPVHRDLLALARRNGQRLLKLVNTLLEFSRIEAGRVDAHYRPTDLAALSADLASNFRATCERAGLALIVECPPLPAPVYVDQEMWERIVLNLLSNAFKYTLSGSITVAMDCIDGAARLTVRDTGVGIAAADVPRLFNRFQRLEGSRGRSHEGTGIGLALVHELVRLHGGTVQVDSSVGVGSSFIVKLPLGTAHLPAERIEEGHEDVGANPARAGLYVQEALSWIGNGNGADPASGEEVPEVESRRGRILLAEDNADMRAYVRRLLAPQFEVETAVDGEQAVQAVLARPPDLVVSDVMMPKLDGYGLLKALRADHRSRTVPFLMLSARAGEDARAEGLEAGADDYLAKPFTARELLARVRGAIELRRARSQFETLLNRAPLGVYLVDADFRVREVNPVAREAFGDIPGLVGRDFEEVLNILWDRPYAAEIAAVFRHTLETGDSYATERIEQRRDRGATAHYDWRVDRIVLGDGRYGVVCYFRDISRHVLAEQALREADRRKDEFLAILAHELRNPLAPIRMAAEVLRRAPGEPEGALARQIIGRQINSMARLIDDLMDVSRVSRGKIELRIERMELAAAISSAIETSRPVMQAARQELTVTMPAKPIVISGDRARLAQVFANLLNNAAKYSKPGSRIALSGETSDGHAVVRVVDQGIGIPPDMLESIWDMFVQVDRSLERAQGGLGIGLTLVRSLVGLHGGSVEAHSAGEGSGSEFIVRLPLADVPAEATAGSGGETSLPVSLAGVRVLVADDNVDAAQTLAMLLRMSGCDVTTAHDGPSALDLSERFRPEIAFLDLGMPELNGLDVARGIRARPWGRSVTLIALTGWGQQQDRHRSSEAGFDHHLVKPVSADAVQQLVARRASLREDMGR